MREILTTAGAAAGRARSEWIRVLLAALLLLGAIAPGIAGAQALTLAPGSLPEGVVGTAYEQPITASGGMSPYSYAITAGSLPAGMAMDGDGIVDSTPEEAGSFDFTVTATDAQGQTGEHAYTLVIRAPVISLTPTAVPDAGVGVDYEVAFSAGGGNGPYTFAVSAGTIPPGLFLASDGILNGAPTTPGDYGFTVTATDNYNQTGEHAYTLTVRNATIVLSPGSLPAGVVGTAYEQPITASGGTAPYSYALTAGALPAGMAMDGDGIFDGTPEEAGTFDLTVTATDAYGQTGEQAYSLVIQAPVIVIAPGSVPGGTVGVDYAATFSADGGNGPYTFAVTDGATPPGLFLSSDGALDGTPTAPGDYGFTVTATDNYNQTGEQSYTLHIAGATIVLAPATLGDAMVGTAYEQAISASGGTGPYAFTITGGALPPGMAMDGDGVVDGTPEQAGTFSFTVTATDAFEQTGTQAYVLVVQGATILITPGTLDAATVGTPYQQVLSASGGVAPYSFAVSGGALPPGLVLGGDGVLAGSPTDAGTYAFTATATDAYGQQGHRELVLSISGLVFEDPTGDPDVIGLVTSQVSTVRTFATSQIGNVHDRLETLHDGGGSGWGFWLAGSFRSGNRDGNGNVSPLSFETSGMTGGSDYRPSNAFAFGGGLGYARDRTAVGDAGSRADGDAPSGVTYMSWHPEDLPFFLDGMGGHQRLAFDLQRVTPDGTVLQGRRSGKQRFTSWSGGYERRTDTFLFSPYARVDSASARLHGFQEQGDDPLALQFGSQAVDLRTATLGFRMKYRKEVAWGTIEPRLRMEFQRDFHEDHGVSIRYANVAESPMFFTAPMGLDENRVVLELGTVLRTNWYDLLVRVDYLGVFGGANDNEHMVRFSFQED